MSISSAASSAETAEIAASGVVEHISGIGGAFTIAVIAFSVVFLVLGGLSGIIFGIKYIAAALEKKSSPSAPAKIAASTPAPAPAPSPASDSRLVAIISAAIAASGIRGRITGISLASGSRARPIRSSGWKSAGISGNNTPFGREWK